MIFPLISPCKSVKSVLPASSSPTCWPNEQETLLLRACLNETAQALPAWNEFCSQVDIEKLNEGCYRLFPLVAGNLQNCGHAFPHQKLIFGVLRHAWVKNQRLCSEMAPLLTALREAGIKIILLKGAALQKLYLQQGAVRGMADLDILIHPEDLTQSIEILRELKCTVDPAVFTSDRILELLRFRHELTVKNGAGMSLDIHWYLVSDYRDLEAEDFFWRDSMPCPFGDVSTRALSLTDQLLHTCLHGAQWNEVSPIRWLVDAALLVRENPDWLRLEAQTRRLECVKSVRETLLFLDGLGMNLPQEIMEHWRQMELSRLEKKEGGYRAYRPNSGERTKQLAWIYYRLNRHLPFRNFIVGIPAYMRQLHHFRAYARCVSFLGYLFLLMIKGKLRSSRHE